MFICSHCGANVDNSSSSCRECGAAVAAAARTEEARPNASAIPDCRPATAVVDGDHLAAEVPHRGVAGADFILKGESFAGEKAELPVNDNLLAGNMLLLGDSGTGKTGVFMQTLPQLRDRMSDEDVLLAFDRSGELFSRFSRPEKDVVFSSSPETADSGADHWNIFREINAAPDAEAAANAIADSLFLEKLRDTNPPFIAAAARDLFAAVLCFFPHIQGMAANNLELRAFLDQVSPAQLRQLVAQVPAFRGSAYSINDPESGKTLAVMSILRRLAREVFSGDFKKIGFLSIRELVRDRGGKVVFIRHDPGQGKVLAPVKRLLLDLAIHETLTRKRVEKGRVFFLLDDFHLLPALEHAGEGVCSARNSCVRFVVAVQNLEQLAAVYGKKKARVIASGMGTVLTFRISDPDTRKYVQSRYGANLKQMLRFSPALNRGVAGSVHPGNVVEDCDLLNLGRGQAIVGLPAQRPFCFRFDNAPERQP